MFRRTITAIALLTFSSISVVGAYAQDMTSLRIGGYPEVLQQHDMKELDASINFGMAMEALLEDEALEASLTMYENPAMLKEEFAAGRLDAAFLTTPDYLAIRQHVNPQRVFTLSWDGKPTLKYVLVSNQKSVKSIRNLQGKRLTLGVGTQLGSLVLFDHVRTNNIPAGNLFKSISRVRNSETAMIDLMFGKTDSALIPSIAFELAKSENPQLASLLYKVFESKGYVPGVFVMHRSVPDEVAARLEDRFNIMHELPEGRLVLDLFHARHMVKVTETDLSSVADLVAAL